MIYFTILLIIYIRETLIIDFVAKASEIELGKAKGENYLGGVAVATLRTIFS
jgi:hypothetical protein